MLKVEKETQFSFIDRAMTRENLEQLAHAALPLIVGGAALAAAELGRRAFRDHELFCPVPEPLRDWNPATYGLDPSFVDELFLPTGDGHSLHAWYCRAKAPIASAVYCHGNTGNLTWFADEMRHLVGAGFSVLLFDYRGFGQSGGRPDLHGVIKDAILAAKKHDELRPAGIPSLAYGFSLGGAIAAQMAARIAFDGLVLQSTFTSLPDIARVTFPSLPIHLLSGHHFDTRSVVRELQIPLLVVHGSEDEAIPHAMGEEIFEAASGPKRLVVVSGGLHKDLYTREPERIVRELRDFVGNLPERRKTIAGENDGLDTAVDRLLHSVSRLLGRSPEGRHSLC
ncbi:MAG: alpha/beta hydrolase [Acidobacteria bacterium]|nr:alpha/beta hydrolase [Acidobacteriota bacterium]